MANSAVAVQAGEIGQSTESVTEKALAVSEQQLPSTAEAAPAPAEKRKAKPGLEVRIRELKELLKESGTLKRRNRELEARVVELSSREAWRNHESAFAGEAVPVAEVEKLAEEIAVKKLAAQADSQRAALQHVDRIYEQARSRLRSYGGELDARTS